MNSIFECPWCAYQCEDEYNIHLHIEENHTEDSRFVSDPERTSSPVKKPSTRANKHRAHVDSVRCTRAGCGKRIYLDEIDEHLASHESEPVNEPALSAAVIHEKAKQVSQDRRAKLRKRNSATGTTRSESILNYLAGRPQQSRRKPLEERKDRGRLGTKELGQHAFEKSMPSSVRRALEAAAIPVEENRINTSGRLTRHIYYSNETSGLIPILADIAALDNTVTTYFCHASAKHIHRIRCDGNFCGYWNIQMLLSHILAATDPDRGLPTVLQMQDIIEKAWSNNICSYGRVETGGIFDTRKWIGTHEALAFFRQLDRTVSANSFKSSEQLAYSGLLDFVEAYFLAGLTPELEGCSSGSIITQLPPIYLQRAGHSVTIVGVARHDDGQRHLLIFDPSHDTTFAMTRVLGGRSVRALPEALLRPYIWSESKLAAWDEYETLIIDVSDRGNLTDDARVSTS